MLSHLGVLLFLFCDLMINNNYILCECNVGTCVALCTTKLKRDSFETICRVVRLEFLTKKGEKYVEQIP